MTIGTAMSIWVVEIGLENFSRSLDDAGFVAVPGVAVVVGAAADDDAGVPDVAC